MYKSRVDYKLGEFRNERFRNNKKANENNQRGVVGVSPEKKCPECSGSISWKIVYNVWGAPTANGICRKCNIVFRGREAPEITKGKNMERHYKIGDTEVKDMHCMDKRITRLPCNVQIGILRERQHGKNGYLNKRRKRK